MQSILEMKKWEPFLSGLGNVVTKTRSVKTILSLISQQKRALLMPLLPDVVETINKLNEQLHNLIETAKENRPVVDSQQPAD